MARSNSGLHFSVSEELASDRKSETTRGGCECVPQIRQPRAIQLRPLTHAGPNLINGDKRRVSKRHCDDLGIIRRARKFAQYGRCRPAYINDFLSDFLVEKMERSPLEIGARPSQAHDFAAAATRER